MVALQIPQLFEIRCLCINDVVCSYSNWGRLHGNRPISWSLQTLFTYPTLSSLFNILHPSKTPIRQTLQYFISDPNSYIHTTHNINAFFVKIADASIFSWPQEITSILWSVIIHNDLFRCSTFWIPHTHLHTSLKYFWFVIIFHSLQTSWAFYIQLYHATNF